MADKGKSEQVPTNTPAPPFGQTEEPKPAVTDQTETEESSRSDIPAPPPEPVIPQRAPPEEAIQSLPNALVTKAFKFSDI